MNNKLSIKSELWPDVTERLHFVIDIMYEGCTITHDDIYFDDESIIVTDLKNLDKQRSGKVILDGGERFSLVVEATKDGGLEIRFKATADATFPGKLTLEGVFPVEGEYTESVIHSLISLFQEGGNIVI